MIENLDDIIDREIANEPDEWSALDTTRHSHTWWPVNSGPRICSICKFDYAKFYDGNACCQCLDGISAFYDSLIEKKEEEAKQKIATVRKRRMNRLHSRIKVSQLEP
jgi:hypothetical protein